MYIVYLDETGNTGTNLSDSQQPVFLLSALLVPEGKWQALEKDLQIAIDSYFPERPEGFEVHAAHVRNGGGLFRKHPISYRIQFRDEWFGIARRHDLKLIYRAIDKKRFQRWMHQEFGAGIQINPHVVAFPLVARVVDEYLQNLAGSPLGIFVMDENKEIVHDIEKSLRMLRGMEGSLRLSQIIEKGFFIDSAQSLPLQLCDLCALSLRKMEERDAGIMIREFDKSGIQNVAPLVVRGNEALWDVLEWISHEQKNSGQGINPRSISDRP